MRLGFLCLALAVLVRAEAPLRPGDPFPGLEGTSLSGRKTRLPEAAAGKTAVVIIGFTKEAGRPSMEWAKRFLRDHDLAATPVFQIPIIEHAPRLLRPLIASSLRRQVEPALHNHALLSYRDEKIWKLRTGFSQPDASYIFVVDGNGRILARAVGHYQEREYQMLRAALQGSTPTLSAAGN